MNVFSLKMIAITSMLIDHIGIIIFYDSPYYFVFRLIGRVCFPIMAFLISEGFIHTRNFKQYCLRLGIFALISEPIYDYSFYGEWFYWGSQNIFFNLILGLLAIQTWDSYFSKSKTKAVLIILSLIILADFIHADYGSGGTLLILLCYWGKNTCNSHNNHKFYFYFLLGNILITLQLEWCIQIFSVFALLFIAFYNKCPGPKTKYLFYAFYPIHLYILDFILWKG